MVYRPLGEAESLFRTYNRSGLISCVFQKWSEIDMNAFRASLPSSPLSAQVERFHFLLVIPVK